MAMTHMIVTMGHVWVTFACGAFAAPSSTLDYGVDPSKELLTCPTCAVAWDRWQARVRGEKL